MQVLIDVLLLTITLFFVGLVALFFVISCLEDDERF